MCWCRVYLQVLKINFLLRSNFLTEHCNGLSFIRGIVSVSHPWFGSSMFHILIPFNKFILSEGKAMCFGV